MKKHVTYTTIATVLMLSLGLVTGCDASGDTPSNGGKEGSSGAPDNGEKPKGPVYDGPAIPGLGEQPAWSMPRADAIDLGDTFLFVSYADGRYSTDDKPSYVPPGAETSTLHASDEPEPVTLEFRDVKTGAVRKTLKVKATYVTATTWHNGVSALEVRTSSTSAADGLTAEKTVHTVTVYGGDGSQLGKAERPQGDFDVHEGHIIESVDAATLQLTPIDGGKPRKVTCTGRLAKCRFDGGKDVYGQGARGPLVTGGYVFHVAFAPTYKKEQAQLVMSDLATGEKVWSTADVTPPAGVELNENKQPASGEIRVLDVRDGKILTAWGADTFASDTWVTATYDVTTGRQIGGAVKYAYVDAAADAVNSDGSFIRSPDHQLAASATENGTAVWQIAEGKELWAQQAGENPMTPRRFSPNGVLYGTVGTDDMTALALESRTKKVLAKNLPTANIPLFNEPSGYGYFSTGSGFFVFPSRAAW
ncbi:hypothetical protein AMK26_23395 [Streptomyces sp. CB03234]|uniref:hypothetical protein n=1 Tax=Streptomyces sp. (strain CB03234) TaxID=1703937 RepID=UPI00093A945C|nr:hypothetical protein [Streptomyces sp. CB03234]OKK02570.1 hypothetical protein AMK26_23395 [Streptomyces sp. CB03234]